MPALTSSIDRPLGLRLRADLLAQPVESSGATTWIVHDPLTLEHFQFSDEEYTLMDWLRCPVAIAELQRRFHRKYSPQTISPEAIWEFVNRLHSSGLVVSDAPGQAPELLQRQEKERFRQWAFAWASLLGIRFRGIDPDRLLTEAIKEFRWLFSPATFIAALAIVLYALSLVFGHFDEFRSRLPELGALVDRHNLPWLLLAIGGVKVLHELGHAMMCKRFGGEVHELGFMLLVFSPCLYCDVSDAWRLPSKWQRVAVSAAGMIVELVLAAVATIVWWFAQPGVVQLVAQNVMIICTVNTLLLNGNPLMRYDGYYILCDLLETPNLWQRSREAFRYFWSDWLLGQPAADDPLIPARKRPLLSAYAVASKVYMSLVCVMIVWGLVKVLYPHHLQNLAYAVGFTVFGSALVAPISAAIELARNPIRRAELRSGRVALLTALSLAAIVAVLAIPIDYRVHAPLILLPEDAARVYATVDGTLASMLPAGTKVTRGQTIGQLTNTTAQVELARLEGELKLRQLHLEHLEKLRLVDPKANDEIPTAQTALADSQRRLDERRNEEKRLTLTAPADGVIIPAPRVPESPLGGAAAGEEKGGTRLAKWSGSLLDPHSTGAHVEAGTLVCLVGEPAKLAAVLLVDDTDIKRLQPNQKARLKIDELPGQILDGEVAEVSRHVLADVDRAKPGRADLSPLLAGLVPPGRDSPHYEVRVRFRRESRVESREPEDGQTSTGLALNPQPSTLNPLLIGARGDAKVTAERITIGRQIYRYLAQTFRLPM